MLHRSLLKESFQIRRFSSSALRKIDLRTHESINDTTKHLEDQPNDKDFKSHHAYLDVIDHHSSKLASFSKDQIENQYNEIYNLSLKLLKMMEETPEIDIQYKNLILNNLIEKFSKFNYAVSNLAYSKLSRDKNSLSNDAINQLILHNPGRVHSSWDLFNSIRPNVLNDEILKSVLKKLVYGDKVEIKEKLDDVNVDKIIKIYQILIEISDIKKIDTQTLTKIVESLIKLECTPLVMNLNFPSPVVESIILDDHEKNFELKNSDYLYFYESSVNNGVSLSGNSLLKSLLPISKLQLGEPVKFSENLQKVIQSLDITINEVSSIKDIVCEIRDQIQELGFDEDTKVMFDLIKSAGFYSKDIQSAIGYFQNYQTKIPDGTVAQNDLKSLMSLCFVYDCIDKDDKKLIEVAEALVPQTPLPASNNLASLILFHGYFENSDKSFDIYNKGLDLYLKPLEGNELPRGDLVQALSIVCLLGKEISLANLIKQKSVETKTINETFEIKLSNLNKEYGDLLESCEDDGKFRLEMKKIILRTIIEMAP